MPDSSAIVIDQLIAERRRQGISQRKLAEKAGFPQSVIARLESKKVSPNIDTLMKVTVALGCKIAIVANEPLEEANERISE